MENPPCTDIFFGDYGENEEEPSLWLSEFQHMLPLTWSDNQKITHLQNHLTPNGHAEEWFDSLGYAEMMSWTVLWASFLVRWPPLERPSFLRAEQVKHIHKLELKEEDVGKWTIPSDKHKVDYRQNLWATEVANMAVSMCDIEGNLTTYVLETIPPLLQGHLNTDYNSWLAFVEAVCTVSLTCMRAKQQHQLDNDIQDQTISALQQQVAQLTYFPPIVPEDLPMASNWAEEVD